MRLKNPVLFVIISLFLLFSCQDNTKNGELVHSTPILESTYKDLKDFEWLCELKSFQEEGYQDRFHRLFDQSVQTNKWDDAAAYLIAYGIAAKQTQTLDTSYVALATQFYEKNAEKISGEAKSTLGHYIAAQYKNGHQFDKAIQWFQKTFEFTPESPKHSQAIGLSHLLLGQIYLEQRDLDKTEKELIDAFRIFEEIEDKENQAKVYLLMHTLYLRINAYDKAEKYLERSIGIFEEVESEFYAFTAHVFYVQYHLEQYDTIKGIQQIDKMAEYAKGYKDITDYHKGFLNQFLAYKYICQRQEDSAVFYIQKSKEISDRTGIPDLKMRTFFMELSFASKFGKTIEDPQEAEWYYQQMEKSEMPNIQHMYQLATCLYEYYTKIGDYKKAHKYGEVMIRDGYKQHAERMKNQLFELETKYQAERKEKIILQQDKKIELKNKTIIFLLLATVFIVLILLLLIIWTKNKSILKEKILTENYTAQLLQKTENERKRIASDLHDSVSNELINLRHVIENKDNILKNKIDNILEEVRNISRNISPTMFDKIGLKLSVEQLTERIQNQHDFFISSEIDYKGGLSSDKELQLYRMIQEAITNILKHADAVAGKILIKENDGSVEVEIKDNGKGFDVDKMLEKGNCFGLLNIRERAKYLNGTVHFQSGETGTIININIPK